MLRTRVASASETDTESAMAMILQLYRPQKNMPALLQFLRNEAGGDHASTTNNRGPMTHLKLTTLSDEETLLTCMQLTRNEKREGKIRRTILEA